MKILRNLGLVALGMVLAYGLLVGAVAVQANGMEDGWGAMEGYGMGMMGGGHMGGGDHGVMPAGHMHDGDMHEAECLSHMAEHHGAAEMP